MKGTFSTNINSNAVNSSLLILRVAVGLFMLTHGFSKLQMLMSGDIKFADPFGIGTTPSLILSVFAEFFCSILLILGLATRLASVALIINMLVAVFYAHATDPFARKELPLMYLVVFLTFLILGAGRYSVDHLIAGNSKKR